MDTDNLSELINLLNEVSHLREVLRIMTSYPEGCTIAALMVKIDQNVDITTLAPTCEHGHPNPQAVADLNGTYCSLPVTSVLVRLVEDYLRVKEEELRTAYGIDMTYQRPIRPTHGVTSKVQ